MIIIPATSNSLQTVQYTTQNPREAKPLTNEVEEPVKLSLSGEGIYLGELAQNVPEGYKIPQLSQSSLKMVEFSIKLMQQMKTQRIDGQSTGNNAEDLAIAYDYLQKNLNENSENSQKHVKFLDDAFKDVSRFIFTQDAQNQYRSGLDLNNDAANRLKQANVDAEKKSALFADSFLKNYKKLGLKAYDTAISLLK